ncbi:MAG: hypothetical protein ACK5G0_08015 [Bacteroidota bacterium]
MPRGKILYSFDLKFDRIVWTIVSFHSIRGHFSITGLQGKHNCSDQYLTTEQVT